MVRATLIGVGLAALLTLPTAVAGQFYRWVDSAGNLSIGDQPPPSGVVGTRPLPLPTYAPPERRPEDDPYSIINQVKRLEEQREARARERQEKRRVEHEYRLRKQELEAVQEPPPQQIVPVYVYPQHFFGRPPYRHRHPRTDRPRLAPDAWHRRDEKYKTPRHGASTPRNAKSFLREP